MELIIAQAGLPDLTNWMVWGPLGVLFAFGLYLFHDYYRSEIKPRSIQRRVNEQKIAEKQVAYIDRSQELAERQTRTGEQVGASVTQLGLVVEDIRLKVTTHGDDLSWIKRHLRGDSDPSHSAIE